MAKGMSCRNAIAAFEKAKDMVATEADKVVLWGQVPPIDKLDASLSTLKACRYLSLSTNSIEKLSNLAGLDSLEVLSLGRNQIKKLEGLDTLAGTLFQLWLSYNLLEKLTGLEKLAKLRVLYVSNNKVKDWAEVDRLAALPVLEELLFVGNPLHLDFKARDATAEYRAEVLRRLPGLKKLDGVPVTVAEREALSLVSATKSATA